MAPGLNHGGLAQALDRRTPFLRYADPDVFFALPDFPGVGSQRTLEQAVKPTLDNLKSAPFRRLLPQPGAAGQPRSAAPFEWADVIAGDMGAIRRYAPAQLKRKTVVVEWASEADLDDLRQRGVAIVGDHDAVAGRPEDRWASGRRPSSRRCWWPCAPTRTRRSARTPTWT